MKSKLSIDTEHITHSRFFFFNDTATTEIYTLSLHDALPISRSADAFLERHAGRRGHTLRPHRGRDLGRDPGAEGGHAAAGQRPAERAAARLCARRPAPAGRTAQRRRRRGTTGPPLPSRLAPRREGARGLPAGRLRHGGI